MPLRLTIYYTPPPAGPGPGLRWAAATVREDSPLSPGSSTSSSTPTCGSTRSTTWRCSPTFSTIGSLWPRSLCSSASHSFGLPSRKGFCTIVYLNLERERENIINFFTHYRVPRLTPSSVGLIWTQDRYNAFAPWLQLFGLPSHFQRHFVAYLYLLYQVYKADRLIGPFHGYTCTVL